MVAYAQFVAEWNVFSYHAAMSRWFMVLDSSPSGAQLTAGANAINAAFAAQKSWMSSSSAFIQAYGQEVDMVSATGGYRIHPLSTQHFGTRVDSNGTGSAAGSSPQVAYRVTLQTALAGRANRGRMFLPGVPEDKVDAGGTVDATAVANAAAFVADAADRIETALVALTAQWVLAQPKTGTFEVIVSALGRSKAGTQRRRLKATQIP